MKTSKSYSKTEEERRKLKSASGYVRKTVANGIRTYTRTKQA